MSGGGAPARAPADAGQQSADLWRRAGHRPLRRPAAAADLHAAPRQGRGRQRRRSRRARGGRRDDRAARPRQRALPLRGRARGRRSLRRCAHSDRDLLRLGHRARAIAALATPVAAPLFLGDGNEALWLVACAGLLISLLYEPCAGLYRVEQRPQRFLAVTLVNVAVTVVLSVVLVVHFDGGAFGARRRLLHRHARRAARRAVGPARASCSARSTASSCARCCSSACPSCPRGSRSGRSTSPTASSWRGSPRGAHRGRLRRRREHRAGGRAARDGVPARLAALRLCHQVTTARRASSIAPC